MDLHSSHGLETHSDACPRMPTQSPARGIGTLSPQITSRAVIRRFIESVCLFRTFIRIISTSETSAVAKTLSLSESVLLYINHA